MAAGSAVAQLPPPGDPPPNTWEPQALLPLQIDPPQVMHVIAGSVITLAGPIIVDDDTIDGQLVSDDTWTYALDTGGVGSIVESDTTLADDPPYFVWQAPTSAAVAEMTMEAHDTGDSATCDPYGVEWTYEVHVHELEIYQIWGGLTMYDEADGQTQNASWHGLITCGDGSGHWDNDPNSPLDTKLYDVAGGANPGLFAGQSTASLSLMIRPKDHATWSGGAVEPQAVRIHAAWTAEGTSFEVQTTISQLPVTVYPQTTSAIDAEVSHYDSVTWDWQYDIPYGSAHEHTVAWGGDPTTASWVATGHHTPIEPTEVTPRRVRTIYKHFAGHSSVDAICGTARTYIRQTAAIQPAGRAWAADVLDTWCMHCHPSYGYDCISLAGLATRICRLTGVYATEQVAYPRDDWGNGVWPWTQVQNCFSGLAGHSTAQLLFISAGDVLNRYEGYYHAPESDWYYTVWPVGEYSDLASMVTAISVNPTPPPDGDLTEGYACLHAPLGVQHGEQTSEGLHLIPEPSP
jgi:hypothetical protein